MKQNQQAFFASKDDPVYTYSASLLNDFESKNFYDRVKLKGKYRHLQGLILKEGSKCNLAHALNCLYILIQHDLIRIQRKLNADQIIEYSHQRDCLESLKRVLERAVDQDEIDRMDIKGLITSFFYTCRICLKITVSPGKRIQFHQALVSANSGDAILGSHEKSYKNFSEILKIIEAIEDNANKYHGLPHRMGHDKLVIALFVHNKSLFQKSEGFVMSVGK